MKKLLRAIVIALFICNVFVSTIYAEPKMKEYYSIDLDSLNVNVRQYLTSLSIDKDTKAVFMNNVYVGTQTSDPQTFVLSTENYSISANVSVSNLSCTAKVNVATEKHYTAVFDIQIAENTYYVCNFYPDYKSNPSYCITNKATRNGDIQDFGTFSYTYGNESKSFSVLMTQSDGTVYVNGNKIGTLSKSNLPIVFEYIGSDFPITSIDYMHGSLAQFTWSEASQEKYPFYNRETDFNNISIKQDYEYSNEYLALPSVNKANGPWVNEYKRVSGSSTTGTGVWQSTGNKLWVVCEYYENEDCGNAIRKEFPRYWAVYGTELEKTLPVVKKNINVEDYVTKYKNYYYPDSMWVKIDNYVSTTGATSIQYRQRTASWSDWTTWDTYDWPSYACSGGFCQHESKKFYRYRTVAWSGWSNWSTDRSVRDDCEDVGSSCKWETKAEYSNWHYGVNMSGSYTDQCEYKYYTKNYSCGSTYVYSNYGPYEQNKYGYTDKCNSRTGNNSECGVSSYTYSNYGSYRTSKYGYTDKCNSRSGRNSECGSENKSCIRYYCATSRTCIKKTLLGICTSYSYSNYKYTYGSKPSPAYNCSSSNVTSSSCGTQNKSCTSYSCAQSKSPNYSKCTSYSCAKTRNTEYLSCYMYNCPHTKTNYWRAKYKSYSAWSDYNYTSCPYIPGVEVECTDYVIKHRYKTKAWNDWSSWMTAYASKTNTIDEEYEFRRNYGTYVWETTKGTSTKGSATIGWYSGESDSTNKQKINVDAARQSTNTKSYANKSLYTQSDVLSFQSEYAKDSAGSNYLTQLLNSSIARGTTSKYVTWSDFNYGITNYNGYTIALNKVKDKKIYSPYLYFYGWRFFTSETSVPSGTTQKTINATDYINYSSSGILVVNSEPMERDTKVIYFDYHDPLTHYKDELPENWQGYEYLVDEIKNSDLDTSKIKVKLSANDILAMKEYLENGGYDNVSDCEMIRQFSYIFVTTDSELQNWLNSGSGCKIGD